jgi:hypothetical protein
MVDENKIPDVAPIATPEEKKPEGKKLELNLNDTVETSEKIGTKLNKEQLEKVEKSLLVFLFDLKKTLGQARDIVGKLGFTHLVVALKTPIDDIDVYLEQYKKDKSNGK